MQIYTILYVNIFYENSGKETTYNLTDAARRWFKYSFLVTGLHGRMKHIEEVP